MGPVMKERPILFSAPMVLALLDGRKTQTRRIVKDSAWREDGTDPDPVTGHRCSDWYIDAQLCPNGQTGDRLWVREAWGYRCGIGISPTSEAVIEYRADGARRTCLVPEDERGLPQQRPGMSQEELYRWWRAWRPSIHMPRWASRIDLNLTGVRIERLQDISEADAIAEGITEDAMDLCLAGAERMNVQEPRPGAAMFRWVWEEINGAGAWDANPWVWVLEFRKVSP